MAGCGLYECFEDYHGSVNQERRETGIPVIQRNKKQPTSYVREDGLPLERDWWDTLYSRIIDPVLCEAFKAMEEKMQALLANPFGADSAYMKQFAARSLIHSRIHCCAAKALEAWRPPPRCLRVCLAGEIHMSLDLASAYDETIIVHLDDGAPMLDTPVLTREAWESLRAAVLRAAARWEEGWTMILHCAQGQSRSVLATVLLILHLHSKGLIHLDFIDNEGTDMEKMRDALLHVSKCRPLAKPSSCWYVLYEFLGSGIFNFATLDLK